MSRTKWRLTKGDEQLDHAFASLGHHVSDDCLSAVAVCAYTARRLPLAVLAETVRASVVPEEYPATMARMYEWSPDEAVPEFYDDPSVFESVHDAMPDLEVPDWGRRGRRTEPPNPAPVKRTPPRPFNTASMISTSASISGVEICCPPKHSGNVR